MDNEGVGTLESLEVDVSLNIVESWVV